MTDTRVSLPTAVSDRWRERLDWYLDDPESYDLSEMDIDVCGIIRSSTVKFLKTRVVYNLPYFGPDHALTRMVERSLNYAIYDTYSLGEDITASHEAKLQKMLSSWVQTGQFKLRPVKPQAREIITPEIIKHREVMEAKLREYLDYAIALLMRPESPQRITRAFRNELILKISWAQARYRSYGGLKKHKPYISLAMNRFNLDKAGQRPSDDRFIEYPSIQKSPVIGSSHGSLEVALATLIAHEVAHAAQHACLHGALTRKRLTVDGGMRPSVLRKPHGQGWQEIYRYLRVEWVNQMHGYQQYVHGD